MYFINTQLRSDKLAISLSLACVIHCLFVPSFVILSSAFFATTFDNEFVHNLILFFAIPISLFALALGYKNHGALSYFLVGIIGLIILIAAVFLGEPLYGETGEILFTMLGSVFVVFAHYKNHQICKERHCSCHDD